MAIFSLMDCIGRIRPNHHLDSSRCLHRILVLPDANYAPSPLGQQSVSLGVTFLCSPNLLGPEAGVRNRHRVVLRTAVPETAIHEDRHFCPREYEIRSSANRFERTVRDSVAQPQRVYSTA